MRGLKRTCRLLQRLWSSVAPYVGAWIETSSWPKTTVYPFVAPYVGAWIETVKDNDVIVNNLSHPTWVRGLKHVTKSVRRLL